MVNSKDIPTKTMKSQNIPKTRGHVGDVIDSGLEKRADKKVSTIRK